jgi:acyl carrier protein
MRQFLRWKGEKFPHIDGWCRRIQHFHADAPFHRMIDEIRAIIRDHAHLSGAIDTLTNETDLYQAGMTSHASVNVMLALEGKFGVEFPDHMLRRSVFESIAAIRAALEELVS